MAKLLAKYIIGKPEVKIVDHRHPRPGRRMLQANVGGRGLPDVHDHPAAGQPGRLRRAVLHLRPRHRGQKDDTSIKSARTSTARPSSSGPTPPPSPRSKSSRRRRRSSPSAPTRSASQALKQDRGDAYVQDETLLVADAKADPAMKVVGEPFTTEPVRHRPQARTTTQFKAFVNDWLKKIQADGAWQKVWKDTLGTVVEGEAPTPPAVGSVPGLLSAARPMEALTAT